MKIRYAKLNFSKLLMLFAVSSVLISCGTYQQATIEDGIYADETDSKGKKKVIVVNERAYSNYNADYFAEELDLVDEINSEDIFLEEDEYNTIDSVAVSTETENTLAYTPNQSWGNGEKNDVVININVRKNPYWMGDVWAFDAYRFNYWSFNRRRFNNWGWGNNYFYGNGFYGYGWSNYDPYGYRKYAYSYYGNGYRRNGRYAGASNQRRGRYGSYGRRSNNINGRWQLNNSGRVAYNSFTRKNKRKLRSTRNTNTIRNTRNTTSNIKPKPIRRTKNVKNTRTVQPKRTVRTTNTVKPKRSTRTTRSTRNTSPSRNSSTRSTRSSSRSTGRSSSGRSSSRSSSRRKN
jgi:hypothetical protein